MGEIIELGGALISDVGRRLEIVAVNMANVATPGYKALIPFAALLASESPASIPDGDVDGRSKLAPGEVRKTGNPLDLAIEGEGFFVVRGAGGTVYTRAGQFHSDAEGRLVNMAGEALQGGSGDIVIHTGRPQVLSDGTILEDGRPVSRIDIVQVLDPASLRRMGSGFSTSPDNVSSVDNARIGQGELESSNVSSAQEMIAMMRLQRTAENGRQLVQVYDDIIGKVINTFGQS